MEDGAAGRETFLSASGAVWAAGGKVLCRTFTEQRRRRLLCFSELLVPEGQKVAGEGLTRCEISEQKKKKPELHGRRQEKGKIPEYELNPSGRPEKCMECS